MMTRFKYILLLTAAVMAVKGYAATFPTLSFVKTDGSHLTVSVDGLKITYDDFAHAIITNNDTNLTIDLADLKYMYFGTEDTNTHITGDVNDDGEVNIADINAIIDIILAN